MAKCKICDEIIKKRNSLNYCSHKCQMKAWYLKNKEHRKVYRRNWYLKNRKRVIELEKKNGAIRRKKLEDKHKVFLRHLKYVNIDSDLSFKEFKLIKQRDEACVYCGIKKSTDIDHIISIKNNGQSKFLNFVGVCKSCNGSKESKKLFSWFDSNYCKQNQIGINTISPIVLTLLSRRRNE